MRGYSEGNKDERIENKKKQNENDRKAIKTRRSGDQKRFGGKRV